MFNLPQEVKNRIARRVSLFSRARRLINERKESYASDYGKVGGNTLQTQEALREKYIDMATTSGLPNISRLIHGAGEKKYLWGQKDIAIVLGQNHSTTSRAIAEMEKSATWRQGLAKCKEMRAVQGGRFAFYDDSVFDLIVDFYENESIERYLKPRNRPSRPESEQSEIRSFWKYLKENPDNRLGIVEQQEQLDVPVSEKSAAYKEIVSGVFDNLLNLRFGALFTAMLALYVDLSTSVRVLYYIIPLGVFLAFLGCVWLIRKHFWEPSIFMKIGAGCVMFCIIWFAGFTARTIRGDKDNSALLAIPGFRQLYERMGRMEKTSSDEVAGKNRYVSDTLDDVENFLCGIMEEDQIVITQSALEEKLDLCNNAIEKIDGNNDPETLSKAYKLKGDVLTVWGQSLQKPEKLTESRIAYKRALENAVSAQTKIDALISFAGSHLIEVPYRLRAENTQKAMDYLDTASADAAVAGLGSLKDETVYGLFSFYGHTYHFLAEKENDRKAKNLYLSSSVSSFNKALEITKPKSTNEMETLNALAISFRWLGKYDLAVETYERALANINVEKHQDSWARINANLAVCLMNWAEQLSKKDRQSVMLRAKDCADEAIKFSPKTAWSMDYLTVMGELFSQLGRQSSGTDLLNKAIETFDRVLEVYTPRESLQKYLATLTRKSDTYWAIYMKTREVKFLRVQADILEDQLKYIGSGVFPELKNAARENLSIIYMGMGTEETIAKGKKLLGELGAEGAITFMDKLRSNLVAALMRIYNKTEK